MKLLFGIKQNDKVIFLTTKDLADTFDAMKFVSAIKNLIDIYFKQDFRKEKPHGEENTQM